MPLTTQGSSQPAATAKTINPADFSTVIDNPFSPLEPGTTFVSKARMDRLSTRLPSRDEPKSSTA
jgi:hypothetical protein